MNHPGLLMRALLLVNWDITEVVSGCARGVDLLGEAWAKGAGIPVTRFPAIWEVHGKAAGAIRNQQMAEYAKALVAIWDGKSPGTKDMIRKAKARGLKVVVFNPYKIPT